MILVEGLTKYYGNYIGIENVSFSVSRGEVVGFLGPNGAGKTTTMRILTCAMPASSGTASVAGYDILRHSLEVRKHIGYLPETPPLYAEMTVEAYLRFVAQIKGIPRPQRRSRLEWVLEVCGLESMRRRIVGQLSKGYRQRVGIAQALIHNPDVLIFDEPTSGLDPTQIIEIRQLIRELGKEHTVILSTHILPEASMTCGRLLIVNEGRLVGDVALDNRGEIRSVRSGEGTRVEYGEHRSVRVVVRGNPPDVESALRSLPQVTALSADEEDGNRVYALTTPTDSRPEIATAVLRAGGDLLELREVRPSLEQLFLELTQQRSAPRTLDEETLAVA